MAKMTKANAKELRNLRIQRKKLDDRIAELEALAKEDGNNHEWVGVQLTLKTVNQSRIDPVTFKSEFPELYNSMLKTVSFVKVTVK